MDTDETVVLFSEGMPETEVLEYQVEAAEGGTERHQMLLSAFPLPFLSLWRLSYVVAHTWGTTEREKWIGLKVSLNKNTSASMTGRVCSG